jgi:hypothetical protein
VFCFITHARQGYNPEILGTISTDGEDVLFEDVMKARLEVDYWIKCITLNLRHTLRSNSKKCLSQQRDISIEDLARLWEDTSTPVQIIIACVHVVWSEVTKHKDYFEVERRMKPLILRLRMESLSALAQCCTEGLKARQRAKLFLTEYYLAKFEDLDSVDLVTYSFDKNVGVLRLTALNRTYTYGYEYHAQKVCFSPILSQERAVHYLLKNVVQGFTSTLTRALQSPHLQTLAFLFGRYFHNFLPGFGQTLENVLLGTIVSGSWLLIDSLDMMDESDVCTIRTLNKKLSGLCQQKTVHILSKDVEVKADLTHQFFLSQWVCGGVSFDKTAFRYVELITPRKSHLIRSALVSKGSIKREMLQEFSFVVDEFLRAALPSGSCTIVQQMLAAIRLSSLTPERKEVYKNFLQLGARSVLSKNAILRRNRSWPGEFRLEMDRMLSIDEQLRESMSDSDVGSDTLLENFKKLQRSVAAFPVTLVDAGSAAGGNVLFQRCTSLLETQFSRDGADVLSLCAETQLTCQNMITVIKKTASRSSGDILLVVMGRVSELALNSILYLQSKCRTSQLRVLVLNCGNFIPPLDTTKIFIPEDDVMAVLSILRRESLTSAITRRLNDLAAAIVSAAKAASSLGEVIFPETIASTLGILVRDREYLNEGNALLDELIAAVATHLPSSKMKTFVSAAQSDPAILSLCDGHFNWESVVDPNSPRKCADSELRPQLSIERGNTDLFVPTKEITRVVNVLSYCLQNKCSVFLFGKEGTGKTTAIGKMLESLHQRAKVIFMKLGIGTGYGQEDALLRSTELNGETIIVLEGFRFDQPHHISYAESLLGGRTLYNEEQENLFKICRLTLCIEATEPAVLKGDQFKGALSRLKASVIPIHMRKPFDDDTHVLTSAMSIFAKDFSDEIQTHIPEIKSFIIGWHKFMRNKYAAITDHVLYRLVSGILLANPDEVTIIKDLNCHLYHELDSEYSCFANNATTINALLEEFSPYLKAKLFEGLDGQISYFHSTENGCSVVIKETKDVVDGFLEMYESIKGSAYNNSLTFTSQMVTSTVKLIRSYERYQNTVLVGPSGSGKRSTIAFFAHYMELKLKVCPPSFDKFREMLQEGFVNAVNGEQVMIYIPVTDILNALNMFELLDGMQYYGDLPAFFTDDEKSKQLFGKNRVDEYEAMCDESKHRDAVDEKLIKLQDNLHVVIDLRSDMLEDVYSQFPHLFAKSGVVDFHDWSKPVLESLGRERLAELTIGKGEFPLEAVCKCFAALHLHMVNAEGDDQAICSSQFLDLLALFPDLYRPLRKKLMVAESSLKAGIQCVVRSNVYIMQLSSEISVKEPAIHKMAIEIEQLNKRLVQERLNLDKASKAFRRKEVAARKKSEDTQELAADAHKNLEHALPSLEAAVQAITAIEKTELQEMRQTKTPPEIIQQALEAVCILLGVKADWANSRSLLGDPYLQQRMIDIEKENIPEQVGKRIRRYIDNPKFIPDEVAKTSKAAAAMCMWVRAVDLYIKIFKSIEPKRLKLLQAESELAELMTALREETDRVAHTETTIASIQSNMADQAKRKTSQEVMIKQTTVRLERSQMLSYSLEEECKKWREQLSETEEKRKVLCGEVIILAMMSVYGCRHKEERRLELAQRWREIVEGFAIRTSSEVSLLQEFFSDHYLVSWLSAFQFYNFNYLSVLTTNKWSILQDPNDLSVTYFQDQNPQLVSIDFHDKDLVENLKYAVVKGSEVLVTNFHLPYPPELADLFERNMSERVHAFIGLIGVPYIRKDNRVIIDGQEVICHSKFFLTLHSRAEMYIVGALTKHFNIVRFDFIEEALLSMLSKLAMKATRYERVDAHQKLQDNIERLERSVTERKGGVLANVISAGEDFLEDQSLVSCLKEAKAKVFESHNDLVLEKKQFAKLDNACLGFKHCARRFKCFIGLCSIIKEIDPSFAFVASRVFDIVESESTAYEIDELYAGVMRKCLHSFTLSLLPSHRQKLHIFSELIALMHVYFDEVLVLAGFKKCLEGSTETILAVEHLASKCKVELDQPGLEKLIAETQNSVDAIEEEFLKELIARSEKRAILLLSNEASDDVFSATTFLRLLNRKLGNAKEPEYYSDAGSIDEINNTVRKAGKEGRWVILDNICLGKHCLDQINTENAEKIFVLGRHGTRTGAHSRDNFDSVTIALPSKMSSRQTILEQLLSTDAVEDDSAKKRCIRLLVRFHLELSHMSNETYPLRFVEIMLNKCAKRIIQDNKNADLALFMVATVVQVYGLGGGAVKRCWTRSLSTYGKLIVSTGRFRKCLNDQ